MGVFGAIGSAMSGAGKGTAKSKPATAKQPPMPKQAPIGGMGGMISKMGLGPQNPPMNPAMNNMMQGGAQLGAAFGPPQMQPKPQIPEGNDVIPSGPPQPMNQFAQSNPIQQSGGIGPSFGGPNPAQMGQQLNPRQLMRPRPQMM